MNEIGNDLFSCPGFAGNEDGRCRFRSQQGFIFDFLNGSRITNDMISPFEFIYLFLVILKLPIKEFDLSLKIGRGC